MGLLDFFRPSWRHSNPDVRLQAVRGLDEQDLNPLKEVVQRDPDSRVRRAAIKKLHDPEILFDVAAKDEDADCKQLAASRAQEMFLVAALSAQGAHGISPGTAARKLTEAQALVQVACKAETEGAQATAVEKLKEPKHLVQVALKAVSVPTRIGAVNRLKDESAWAQVARESDHKDVARKAFEGITAEKLLRMLVKDAKSKAIRVAAKEKLPDEDQGASSPGIPPKEAKRLRQRLTELCVAIERVAHSREDAGVIDAKIAAASVKWEDIGRVPGDDSLQERFAAVTAERAVRQQAAAAAEQESAARAASKAAAAVRDEQRRQDKAAKEAPVKVVDTAADMAAPAPAAPRAKPQGDALIAELTFQCGRLDKIKAGRGVDAGRLNEVEARFRELDPDAPEGQAAVEAPGEDALTMVRRRFFTSVIHVKKALAERQAAEDVAHKSVAAAIVRLTPLDVVTEIKPERKLLDGAVKAGRSALRLSSQAGIQDESIDKLRGLVDRVNVTLSGLMDEDKWRRWANLPAFEQLIKESEALVEILDTVEDKRHVPALLREMQARWKAAGALPQEKSQELWDKFRKACDGAFEKCKDTFAALDAERVENLKKKEALCEKAEGLKDSEEWKETSDAFRALQDEWKAMGPVPEEQRDLIWTRFRTALDHFYGKRAEHDKVRDGDREVNAQKKEGLCIAAERCATSRDWRETADQLKALQEEWKQIGPAPREKNEDLWERFRVACDRFFEARKSAYDAQDAERQENLVTKLALVAEAEEIGALEDREEARNKGRELQRRWKMIGHVPREEADALWAKFRTVCDKIFQAPEEEEVVQQQDPAAVEAMAGFFGKLDLSAVKPKE